VSFQNSSLGHCNAPSQIIYFVVVYKSRAVKMCNVTKSSVILTSLILSWTMCSSRSGEKLIYFITGQDKNQLEKSPLLEKLLKKEYEVRNTMNFL
jgi:HSP90 family molecular chaperone